MPKKRRRASRKHPTQTGPSIATASTSPEIVTAARRLLREVEQFRLSIERHNGSEPALLLPTSFEMLAHTDATLRSDIDTLETAYEIIELRKPVAAASRKGISWQGPLHAERIVDLAKIANDDDVDYYTQWRRNVESIAQRAAIRDEDLKHRCGRPTKTTKSPCSNRPVYVPGRGHAGGLGCTRHLTAVEREVVARYFYDAVAHHDCPGCVAESGIACFTDGDDPRKLRSVDGAWPPTRAFAGEEVHTARLDRVQL